MPNSGFIIFLIFSHKIHPVAAARAEYVLHRGPVFREVFIRHERLHTAGEAAAVDAPRALPAKQLL